MPAADIPVLGLSNLKVFHRFGSAYFLGEKKNHCIHGITSQVWMAFYRFKPNFQPSQ
jgi:hypothetical protein